MICIERKIDKNKIFLGEGDNKHILGEGGQATVYLGKVENIDYAVKKMKFNNKNSKVSVLFNNVNHTI